MHTRYFKTQCMRRVGGRMANYKLISISIYRLQIVRLFQQRPVQIRKVKHVLDLLILKSKVIALTTHFL